MTSLSVNTRFFLSLMFLLCFGENITAQEASDSIIYKNIHTIATSINQKVVLRWAPEDAPLFLKLSPFGYVVSKYELNEQGIINRSTLDTFTIKPLGYNKMKALAEKNESNKYLWTAAQALYGNRNTDPNPNRDIFAKHQEQANNFVFAMAAADLDSLAAAALGLRFDDTNVEPGKSYFYIVNANPNYRQDSVVGDAISITVGKDTLANPIISNAVEGDQEIRIAWNKIENNQYTGYWIEKSKDGLNYDRLNKQAILGGASDEMPSNMITFRDSVSNYTPFYYRIIGVSPFGRNSSPSNPIKAMGRDLTPPLPVDKLKAKYLNNNLIQLDWEPVDDADLDMYYIAYSNKPDGGLTYFDTVKAGNDCSIKHEVENRYIRYFYRILSVDTAGNYAMSHYTHPIFNDTIPPSTPVGLEGYIDTNGVVYLNWQPNPEKDILGYTVHFNNKESHFLTNITAQPITDTFYRDTISLKTLTEEINYAIVAHDYNHNTSTFSKILNLKRPDKIAPSPPVFYSKSIKKNGILLKWYNSSSEDVIKTHLFKSEDKMNWEKIQVFKNGQEEFLDSDIRPNKYYYYRIIAEDDAGLFSENAFDYSISKVKQQIEKTEILDSEYLKEDNHIIIKLPAADQRKYLVYRSNDAERFTRIGVVKAGSQEFIDKRVYRNTKYYYKVIAIDDSGARSPFSKTTKVKTK